MELSVDLSRIGMLESFFCVCPEHTQGRDEMKHAKLSTVVLTNVYIQSLKMMKHSRISFFTQGIAC